MSAWISRCVNNACRVLTYTWESGKGCPACGVQGEATNQQV
jgi:hypothetical protein